MADSPALSLPLFELPWSLTWIVSGLSIGLVLSALVSPHVGKAIEHRGGRLVLALSALAIGVGQLDLALAPNLPCYIGAWVVIGVGMGAGLYDAAFATLGRLYGHDARSAITSLTLFGGFASTVCWPLSAFLVSDIWEGRGRRRGHARRIAAALADDIPVLMSVGELAIPALELFGDDLCRIVEAESPFVRDWLLNKFGSEMARGATMAIRGSLQTQDV